MTQNDPTEFVPLYQAIAKVKAELGPIIKDKTNPFYQSKYTDINGLLEVVEPLLAKHGLLLLQPIMSDGNYDIVRTSIFHIETGTQIASSKRIASTLTDPQKEGGAITYYRRYTLQSLLGLRAEDDDGNGASGNKKSTPKKKVVISDDF